MSDTPETDKEWGNWLHKLKMPIESFVDFARKLERERNKAREESNRLEQLCANVHDRLLRGDDDEELLAMLSEAWAKAARHKEAAK